MYSTNRNKTKKEVLDKSNFKNSGEIIALSTRNIQQKTVTIPLYKKKIQFYEYEFLKSFLFGLYTNLINDYEVTVKNYACPLSNKYPGLAAPSVIFNDENELPQITNNIIYSIIEYNHYTYQFSLFTLNKNDDFLNYSCFLTVIGSSPFANSGVILTDYLLRQSLTNSSYKNKILSLKFNFDESFEIKELDYSEFQNNDFDALFVKENIKNELLKFVKSVERYEKIKTSLRLLLSGAPGCGKTFASRIIINKIYRKATIIVAEGSINFTSLFEFAYLFKPVVIFIDDIDLNFGSRDGLFQPQNLGEFLITLDGIVKNDIFMVNTTNSKELMDEAARRPGRYDMILDFKHLDKNNYMDIIKNHAQDNDIAGLFDERILNIFETNKVVGSFIVTIVKQINIMKKLYPSKDLKSYLNDFIDFSLSGFYKNQQVDSAKLGF